MLHFEDNVHREQSQAKRADRCVSCDYELPDDAPLCPYCGATNVHYDDGWRECWHCQNHYHEAESDGDCPYCENHAAAYGDFSALQRARSIIGWYGPIRGRIPVNRLLLWYWEQVLHAKILKLRGYSERAIAKIEGMSKTAIHNRLLKPFSLIRSEIARITAWLTGPEPIENKESIGIDHPPATATVIDQYRSIITRYGWVTYCKPESTDGHGLRE